MSIRHGRDEWHRKVDFDANGIKAIHEPEPDGDGRLRQACPDHLTKACGWKRVAGTPGNQLKGVGHRGGRRTQIQCVQPPRIDEEVRLERPARLVGYVANEARSCRPVQIAPQRIGFEILNMRTGSLEKK